MILPEESKTPTAVTPTNYANSDNEDEEEPLVSSRQALHFGPNDPVNVLIHQLRAELGGVKLENVHLQKQNLELQQQFTRQTTELEALFDSKLEHLERQNAQVEKKIEGNNLQLLRKLDKDSFGAEFGAQYDKRKQDADSKATGENSGQFPADAYSFMFFSATCSYTMGLALGVSAIQLSLFSLFLLDLLQSNELPANVEQVVRATQAIAIFVSFLTEYDMRTALHALIYQDGLEELVATEKGFEPWKFYVANTIMLLQGTLGQVVTLALIFYSDNVFDLVLNFTAVAFITQFDEVIFYLSEQGYMGSATQQLANKIKATNFEVPERRGIFKRFHSYIVIVFMGLSYVAYAWLVVYQSSNEQLASIIKVEFGDEADPLLGTFSGCFERLSVVGWNERVQYQQMQSDRSNGVFRFCREHGTWELFDGRDDKALASCESEEYLLTSTEARPTSFDLLDASRDEFVLFSTGTPIDRFQMSVVDIGNAESECGDSWNEQAISFESLCSNLFVDSSLTGFTGDPGWSRVFDQLTDQATGGAVQYYQHPVYLGGVNGDELVLFVGQRWVLIRSQEVAETLSLGESLSELPTSSIEFISEFVTSSSDPGTPLGLRWFVALYGGHQFPSADISRPIDAVFTCGECDEARNPCWFEGTCTYGQCECNHGTTGKLCQVKPLGNGECNRFFNTPADDYDGGDCCAPTCVGTTCGLGEMPIAFNKTQAPAGLGYPDCMNPDLVPITINIALESESAPGALEFKCNDILTIRVDEVSDGSETAYIEDPSSCEIRFPDSKPNIVRLRVDIFDGEQLDNPSTLLVLPYTFELGLFSTATSSRATFTIFRTCLKETLVWETNAVNASVLYDRFSYQHQAILLLNQDEKYQYCENQEAILERYAMLAFQSAAPFDVVVTSDDHCGWPISRCVGGRVTQLAGFASGRGNPPGPLASEIGLLTHLDDISLSSSGYNDSPLPSELGSLTLLTNLKLHSNGLTGTIPSQLGNLSRLTLIQLLNNNLEGYLPTELFRLTNLDYLKLSRNDFTGTLPTQVGALTLLTNLSVQANSLSGSIPTQVAALTNLRVFDLANNALTGPIPTQLGRVGSLVLAINALTGPIPSEIGQMSSLYEVFLYDNELTGSIPSEIGQCLNLTRLYLSDNPLTGPIPSELAQMPKLSDISLSTTALTGTIPTEFGLMPRVWKVNLSNNRLTGKIPSELGLVTSLGEIDLSNNALTGPIPSDLGLLQAPKLDLSHNSLTGSIPSEFGLWFDRTRYNTFVDLSSNNLTGTVPSEVLWMLEEEILNLQDNPLLVV